MFCSCLIFLLTLLLNILHQLAGFTCGTVIPGMLCVERGPLKAFLGLRVELRGRCVPATHKALDLGSIKGEEREKSLFYIVYNKNLCFIFEPKQYKM